MPIEAITNREIKDKLNQMLAYQREDPILIRIVLPKIRNVTLTDDGQITVFDKIKKLMENKEVTVTLIINPNYMFEPQDKDLIQKFRGLGVKIHSNTNLHAKLILVQNEKEQLALVGSANISQGGLAGHDEACVYFINEQDQVYEKLFSYVTRMLERANQYIAGSDTTPRSEQLKRQITKFRRKIDKLQQELDSLGKVN